MNGDTNTGLQAPLPRPLRTAALVAVLLAMPGCGNNGDPSLIRASGYVEATDVRVSTKIGGTLEWLPVDEGDTVEKGREIARIETTDLMLLLDRANAEREQADADLRLRLAGARKEDIRETESRVDAARATLDGAEKDLARMQALLDRGSGTAKSRDDALTRRDTARAQMEALEASLARVRTLSRPEEIDAARARLAAADARIAEIRQQVEDATVICPVTGIVTGRLAEPGELLQRGAPLLVISDLSDAWLNVYIAETDLARIRIGQEADVIADDGQVRKGRVTFVASEAEFTPKNVQTRDERVKLVFRIKIGLDNGDGLFKPGMPAEARLTAAPAESR